MIIAYIMAISAYFIAIIGPPEITACACKSCLYYTVCAAAVSVDVVTVIALFGADSEAVATRRPADVRAVRSTVITDIAWFDLTKLVTAVTYLKVVMVTAKPTEVKAILVNLEAPVTHASAAATAAEACIDGAVWGSTVFVERVVVVTGVLVKV